MSRHASQLAVLVTAALVAMTLAPGCVLAVPEISHGDQCLFNGDTACAACLKTSCRTAINACCNDAACSGTDGHSDVLNALDACGTGDVNGCTSDLASATTGNAGAVRACVTTTCSGACLGTVMVPVGAAPGNGRPHESCGLGGEGAYCTCTDVVTSGGTTCSADVVGGAGATCFISMHGCTCGRYTCSESSSLSGRCSCSLSMDASSGLGTSCSIDTSGASSGGTSPGKCCIVLGDTDVSCICDPYMSQCSSVLGEYDVQSCDYADVQGQLSGASRIVQTCSN